MELFSEIYGCYYQVVGSILNEATNKSITVKDMESVISKSGYDESNFFIIPKLTDGEWSLLDSSDEGYISKVDTAHALPLTTLQKMWLKSLLSDIRIRLFLNDSEIEKWQEYLIDVEPLFKEDDFYYYDRFNERDPYEEIEYIDVFRQLVIAVKNKQYVHIDFCSGHGVDIHRMYIPCRIEYSVKNDKFRLLAVYKRKNGIYHFDTINIGRIKTIHPMDLYCDEDIDINRIITNSYYKEPLELIIYNNRNALERTMLHFANYEKNTFKIDENTYKCYIYYSKTMETELLIEVLSFGPMVKVVGPNRFLEQLKARLIKQRRYEYE